jgi:N-acetylglucosaminyldiphosphoundecaprenol N-acetyl-beta-D-mannosaminyltransferase
MATKTRERAEVLGCAIDRLDMAQTVARSHEIIESGQQGQHVAINVSKLVALRGDARLREIVQQCAIVSADGQPIVWASRLLGDPLPERVAGIDLMHELLTLAEQERYAVYFLGAREEVLKRAVANIRREHPRLQIAGYRHGYFEDADSEGVVAAIREAHPHMLFVAMSSPRKEYWLADHRRVLGVPFVMGVGGALDVVAGVARRAPRWAQRAGLEWVFRLAQEPRRLLTRYLASNTRFIALTMRAALIQRKRRHMSSTTQEHRRSQSGRDGSSCD